MQPQRVEAYLDTNAGSPFLGDSWIERFTARFKHTLLGNPSSQHAHGRAAHHLIEEARDSVAASIGENLDTSRVTFTSSGTEANQMVIRSALEPFQDGAWVLSNVEHDSVRVMRGWAEQKGIAVLECPVHPNGLLDLGALETLLKSNPVRLLSMLWVNNETGVIQPIEDIVSIAKSVNVPLHIDAAQAWGKLQVNVSAVGAQWVTFSGHKIGAFAGTGIVWRAPRTPLKPLILGKQEGGIRGGTESWIAIWSLGESARRIQNPEYWAHVAELERLRDQWENDLRREVSNIVVNGETSPRVATSNISFEHLDGESLVIHLDLEGISVSAGAACTSGAMHPSHVLMAMGHCPDLAMASIRVSFDAEWLQRHRGQESLEYARDAVVRVVSHLRKKEPS